MFFANTETLLPITNFQTKVETVRKEKKNHNKK